jgi:hypothetical protein
MQVNLNYQDKEQTQNQGKVLLSNGASLPVKTDSSNKSPTTTPSPSVGVGKSQSAIGA